MAKVSYAPKSLLAFLTAVSFLGWLIGEGLGLQGVKNISIPVFVICFFIWLIFVLLSIGRNVKKF